MSMMRSYSKGILWIFDFFVGARELVGSKRTTLLHGETCISKSSQPKVRLFAVDRVRLVHFSSE